MTELPIQLIRQAQLFLLEFDGVITTEAKDVGLKAQTLSVFAAIGVQFGQASASLPAGLERLVARGTEAAILTNGVRENVFRVLQIKGLTDLFPPEHIIDAISTYAPSFERLMEELIDALRKNADPAPRQ